MYGPRPEYESDVPTAPVPRAQIPPQGEVSPARPEAYRGGRYGPPTVYAHPTQPAYPMPDHQDPYLVARHGYPPHLPASAQPVRPSAASVAVAYSTRTILYILGVIEVLLTIRFVFALFAANSSANFSSLIYGVTGPLVAPFVGVFGNPGSGTYVFDSAAVLAGVVYALAAWGIISLITLYRRHRTEIVTPPGLPPVRPTDGTDGAHP